MIDFAQLSGQIFQLVEYTVQGTFMKAIVQYLIKLLRVWIFALEMPTKFSFIHSTQDQRLGGNFASLASILTGVGSGLIVSLVREGG